MKNCKDKTYTVNSNEPILIDFNELLFDSYEYIGELSGIVLYSDDPNTLIGKLIEVDSNGEEGDEVTFGDVSNLYQKIYFKGLLKGQSEIGFIIHFHITDDFYLPSLTKCTLTLKSIVMLHVLVVVK